MEEVVVVVVVSNPGSSVTCQQNVIKRVVGGIG